LLGAAAERGADRPALPSSIEAKKGSSPNSGERRPDLEEEVGVVAEAVGHALDDLDLVVDPLDEVGAQGESAMGEDARQGGRA
jgi:hypothetical protein